MPVLTESVFCPLHVWLLMSWFPALPCQLFLNACSTAVSLPLSWTKTSHRTEGSSEALPDSLDYTDIFLPVTAGVCSTTWLLEGAKLVRSDPGL